MKDGNAGLPPVDATSVSIQVGRVFDVPEAWLVRDAVLRAPANAPVVLDFHRTAELHDFALAVLVASFARSGRKVTLRGIGAQHRSLLRLLGEVDEAEAPAA